MAPLAVWLLVAAVTVLVSAPTALIDASVAAVAVTRPVKAWVPAVRAMPALEASVVAPLTVSAPVAVSVMPAPLRLSVATVMAELTATGPPFAIATRLLPEPPAMLTLPATPGVLPLKKMPPAAFSVSEFAVVQLMVSLTRMLPLPLGAVAPTVTPLMVVGVVVTLVVPPLTLVTMLTLVVASWVLMSEPVTSPPEAAISKSVGSSSQLPVCPCDARVLTEVLPSTCRW